MPLLANPQPHVMEAAKRYRDFGELMQAIWDFANEKGGTVLPYDRPHEIKSLGYQVLSKGGTTLKEYTFTSREVGVMVAAIPNEDDRNEIMAHLSSSAGRAVLASHLNPTNPRPEHRV